MAGFAAPRKSLGQNFLQDDNVVRNIVALVGARASDTIVEIGPGRGALTHSLLDSAANVHIIEFDRELAEHWRSIANGRSNSKILVHESDVLAFDFSEIRLADDGKLKIVGNLPYNISSPILFQLLRYADLVEKQVVMLQKEVVDRLVAEPGNKVYGRLSVMLQYRYHIERAFTVSPNSFYPAPKVDSAVAVMTPRDDIKVSVAKPDDFSCLVKAAFATRRKTLRNNLRSFLTAAEIHQAGVEPGDRAETLSVDQFVQLANTLSEKTLSDSI